jgi:hypothetical protein
MDEPSSITSMTEQDRQISEIIAEERSRLRNFIRRRVPDPSDAEDIVQEVLYELVEANRLLMPTLFGWRQITFWQALGLLALCRILFGGLGGFGSHRSNSRRRMAERCEQMTPEEREKFRQGFLGRWGRVAPPDSKPSA